MLRLFKVNHENGNIEIRVGKKIINNRLQSCPLFCLTKKLGCLAPKILKYMFAVTSVRTTA